MKTDMTGPIARILLRYGAGALAVQGLITERTAETLMADPDVQVVAALVVGLLVEALYLRARKTGGPT